MTARKMAVGWLIATAGIMTLSACVVEGNSRRSGNSISGPSNCNVGNWYDVGFQDGTSGFPAEKLRDYQRCPAISRKTTVDAYRAGWDAGIANFCSEENGFVTAANGVPDPKVCPRSLSKGYKRGRGVGSDVYTENQTIAERSEKLRVLDTNIRSGRFTPDQLELLINDRRKVLQRLEKDQRQLTDLLKKAKKRGYPVE